MCLFYLYQRQLATPALYHEYGISDGATYSLTKSSQITTPAKITNRLLLRLTSTSLLAISLLSSASTVGFTSPSTSRALPKLTSTFSPLSSLPDTLSIRPICLTPTL